MACQIFSAQQATPEVIADAKSKSHLIIGTHSATHHCDEVISCVLLTSLFPDAVIIRQRDQAVLKLCDIVVDVGGIYDPGLKAFDHHQSTFTQSWNPQRTVRLSSAGLVWRHYGKDLLKKSIAPGRTDDEYEVLHNVLYDLVFECVDAGDNGVKPCHCKPTEVAYIGGFPGLSGLVGACNTSWLVRQHESDCFRKAMEVVHRHFLPILQNLARNWFDAVAEIRSADRIDLPEHPQYQVLLLKEFYMFNRFFKYVLEDEPKVVGALWSPTTNVWCSSFRPWKWLERSSKPLTKYPDYSTSREEALARFDAQMTEYLG